MAPKALSELRKFIWMVRMTIEYVVVGSQSEMRDRRAKRVAVGDHDVALWYVGGTFYAIGNVCAHQHFPMMHQGTLEGLTVRCPMHGWRYSLETGMAVEGSGKLPVFDVRVDGESVAVSKEPRS